MMYALGDSAPNSLFIAEQEKVRTSNRFDALLQAGMNGQK